MTTSPGYVFISYASADRERVLEIVAALREAGITCWLDQHDIEGGANWGLRIAEAIEGCSAFVLMSSAPSLNSRNVRQEIALAWQHAKPYIPLRLDASPIPNDVAYWLATAQWIDVLDHPADAWLPKIEQALSRILAQQPTVALAASEDVSQRQLTIRLPSPPSSFVGREREVAEIAALLHTERIVTLVGPGGIGKTRVAIAVGHRLTDAYRDGVVFIDLSSLRDPALVLPTIAASVGIRESGDLPLFDAVTMVLRSQHTLLILDNVEQVIEAAGDISRLVSACPALAIMSTSREPLRIGGEVEYPVMPLPLPQFDNAMAVERLRSNPTVALFIQRARSSNSGFDLTPENAVDIVAVCQRLDGLPLAIELAAARIRMMPPRVLEERLRNPLGVLTGGARDLPARQRTLSEAIQWSYDLLTPDEQRLFRRFSIFVGGWTVETAERVVNAAELGIDLFDGLASLVDKSLIIQREQADGDIRFDMLGTIREFGQEQLRERDELAAIAERHAAMIATVIGLDGDWWLVGPNSSAWPAVQREMPNIHAALGWLIENRRDEAALRIVGVLRHYWYNTSQFREGLLWSERALAIGADAPPSLRVEVLGGVSWMAHLIGDYSGARTNAELAVSLARMTGLPRDLATALNVMSAITASEGDVDASLRLADDAVAWARNAEHPWLLAITITRLGIAAEMLGQLDQALDLFREALPLTLNSNDQTLPIIGMSNLGAALFAKSDFGAALPVLQEAARLSSARNNRWASVDSLVKLAAIADNAGQSVAAARLLGAVDAVRADTGYAFYAGEERVYDAARSAVMANLGDEGYESQRQRGAAMTLHEIADEASGIEFP